ncbi:MAG: threonine/serine exporter family protein [Clostridia bacterium]|nr:threonine/serine exporter family protein [Clostridia bacterium]
MEAQSTGQIYKSDFCEYLLCLALDVGEGMLKNGGDVNRVEDTIERICRAYGAEHVEVFTIISVINAAIRMPDGTYSSQLRRVKSTANNLGRLERLNALSREICRDKPSLEEFDEKLHQLKKTAEYKNGVIIGASAIASGAFTLFFGGNWNDALVSALIGVVLALIELSPTLKLNSMARIVFSAFVATVLSGASVEWLGIADSHDAIMTGVIMLLVPGMAFGTAMRDLFYGDLIAGALKTLQAILSSLMIAFGYMLGMTIFGTIAPSDYMLTGGWLIAKEFITALISALAFAVLFRVNKKHLLWAGLGSIVTYGIYYLVVTLSGNVFLAALISAIFTALYSEVSARLHRAPTLVFLITGVIPTVPGRYLYNTMRYLLEQNWPLAMSAFLNTMKIALGIAAGVVGIAIAWGTISGEIKSRRAKALAKSKD